MRASNRSTGGFQGLAALSCNPGVRRSPGDLATTTGEGWLVGRSVPCSTASMLCMLMLIMYVLYCVVRSTMEVIEDLASKDRHQRGIVTDITSTSMLGVDACCLRASAQRVVDPQRSTGRHVKGSV